MFMPWAPELALLSTQKAFLWFTNADENGKEMTFFSLKTKKFRLEVQAKSLR